MRGKKECYLSATMIEMQCLALTGTQHRVQGEDRTYLVIKSPADLSVLILFKMIESIDMTLCVVSFLVNTTVPVKLVSIACLSTL